MDDAGAFLGADLAPRDDAMGIAPFGESSLHLSQVVERADIFPADEFFALHAADNLIVLAQQGVFHRPFGQIVSPAILGLHLHIVQARPHGRGDIARQRPGSGRPDQQGFVIAADEREADEDRVMGHIEIAVGDDLVLADGRAASGTPGHHVFALVDPAMLMALLQEAPDLIVILVAECEVGAAQFGQAQLPHKLLYRISHRPLWPIERDNLVGVFVEQFAQAT